MTTGTRVGHHGPVIGRSSAATGVSLFGAVVSAGTVVAAAVSDAPGSRLIDDHVLAAAVAAAAFCLVGAVIVRRFPAHRLGWLCVVVGVSEAVSGLVSEYGHRAVIEAPGSLPAGAAAASLDAWLWFPAFAAMITLLVAWFPDGRLPRRWVRIPVAVAGVGVVCFVVGTAVMAWRLRGPAIFTSDRIDDGTWLAGLANVGPALVIVGAFGCVAAAAQRLRRAEGRQRLQLLWFVSGAAACVGVLAIGSLDWTAAPIVELVAVPLLAGGVGVALLRHRLLDIELVINRVLLYGTLALLTGALYAGAVAVVGRWAGGGSVIGNVVAAGLVAVSFDRVRRRVERFADRLLFGRRHDPARAMVELTRRVSEVAAPDMLSAIAEAVRAALGVRGARVRVGESGAREAMSGQIDGPSLVRPLEFDGNEIGSLEIEEHAGAPLDAAARSLCDDLAAQASIAARAVLLTAELQRSRARLVAAIDQERRRLRRDLHDGLGTALVGIVMQLEAVGNLLDGESKASSMVRTIEDETRQLVVEARRLVHGLVPAVVEELGLVEALRQHADRLSRGEGRRGAFEIITGPGTDDLPPVVEVAAYVVASEAMTNVARHARAHRCTVRICRDDDLVIEVLDDGIGFVQTGSTGVGLRSMRERTEELGGTLRIERRDGSGTSVLARFPAVLA